MQTVSLRIQPEVWTRCGWAAAEKGVDRSEFARNALANASRDAASPIPRQFRGLVPTASELDLWQKSADYRNCASLEDWARFVLNTVAAGDTNDESDKER